MPDLLLWNNDRKECKLSEVKGPRDVLSSQQLAWLAALSAAPIKVEVFKVKEPEVEKAARGRGRR
jgi:Fanconi-associated nuclease 1